MKPALLALLLFWQTAAPAPKAAIDSQQYSRYQRTIALPMARGKPVP